MEKLIAIFIAVIAASGLLFCAVDFLPSAFGGLGNRVQLHIERERTQRAETAEKERTERAEAEARREAAETRRAEIRSRAEIMLAQIRAEVQEAAGRRFQENIMLIGLIAGAGIIILGILGIGVAAMFMARHRRPALMPPGQFPVIERRRAAIPYHGSQSDMYYVEAYSHENETV